MIFQRRKIVVCLAAALTASGVGVAMAGISDGNYRPERMGCSPVAEDSSTPDRVEPGCQNLTFSVRDGDGNEGVRAGSQQTADGEAVSPDGFSSSTGRLVPLSGLFVFFGADDNLNNGEHDGSSAIANGPSDGGTIVLNADPATMPPWITALQLFDLPYLLTHPVPGADAGFGACADGICLSLQSQRREAYQGGRATTSRSAADYEGKEWDPETCAGPDDTEADCGPGGIATWHDKEGRVTVEPGVQVYEDPDPQGSPLGPHPLPAVYGGTCGVILGGGPVPGVALPASPITNGAGQIDIPTRCR